MLQPTKAPVVADYDKGELEVPHLGVTLRTLLAAAADAAKNRPTKRTWILRYKTAEIGRVKIQGF